MARQAIAQLRHGLQSGQNISVGELDGVIAAETRKLLAQLPDGLGGLGVLGLNFHGVESRAPNGSEPAFVIIQTVLAFVAQSFKRRLIENLPPHRVWHPCFANSTQRRGGVFGGRRVQAAIKTELAYHDTAMHQRLEGAQVFGEASCIARAFPGRITDQIRRGDGW